MHEEEKEEKCTRKDKTNRKIERTGRIEEREKIRTRASRRQREREKKGWKTTEEKRENRRGKREGEEYESKRAAWYARAPLLGLYGNVGQIYHSGLTVQFSYLPRAACRSTPNHPRASGVAGGGDGGERESCWWTGETADRGLKRPIENLQTRCHPLSPASSLHNLLFPSNFSQPRSAILYVPGSSFSFLDLRQRPDWSSTPDCGSSEMTNCSAKQSEMQNFENTWIKVSVCCMTICRDYTHVSSPPKSYLYFVSGSILIFFIEISYLIYFVA